MRVKFVVFVFEILMCVIDANAKCSNFKLQSNGTKIENKVDSMSQLKNVSLDECCHKCKNECRSFTFDKSTRLCYFYRQDKPPHSQICTYCIYYASLKTPKTTVNPTSSKARDWKMVAIIFVSFAIFVFIFTLCFVFGRPRKISGGAKGKINQQNDCKFDGRRLSLISFDENVDVMISVVEDTKMNESDTLHGIADIEMKSFEVDESRAAQDVVEPSKYDVIKYDFNKSDEYTMKSDPTLHTAAR